MIFAGINLSLLLNDEGSLTFQKDSLSIYKEHSRLLVGIPRWRRQGGGKVGAMSSKHPPISASKECRGMMGVIDEEGNGKPPDEIMSSNPALIAIRTPLLRKATKSHFKSSPSLEKLRALFLVSAKLKVEYATQFLVDTFHTNIFAPIPGSKNVLHERVEYFL